MLNKTPISYDVSIISGTPPSRQEAVEAAAANAVESILSTHTKPEAIAKLDYLQRVFTLVDKRIREMILPEIKDCAGADAYDHWTVSAGKMKAKWEYPDTDNHLINLRIMLQAAKKDLEDYEKDLQKTGVAIDANADKLTVTLRERKD